MVVKEGELISSLLDLKSLREIHEMPYRMSIDLCFLHRIFSAQLKIEASIIMVPVLQVRIEIHKGYSNLLKTSIRPILFQTQRSKMVPFIFSEIQDKSIPEITALYFQQHCLF